MSAKQLNERVALITGSTRGIGWQTANLFASEGANLVLNGHGDQKGIEAKAQELCDRHGIIAIGICADFADPKQIQECYKDIYERFKRLDIVINNAGIMENALLGMITPDAACRSFDLNTLGVIHSIQCASKLMRRQGKGVIVNVSSVMGIQGNAGQVVYSGTKAAINGITKAAAKELAPYQIRVNSVAPGMIETDLLSSLSEEKRNETLAKILLGRIGKPEEVAEAILFLASDRSSYITGQVLAVEGCLVV